MTKNSGSLVCLPCLDSPEMANLRKRELDIPQYLAAEYAQIAVHAALQGFYETASGAKVEWAEPIDRARRAKKSIPPETALPRHDAARFETTTVQVTNETTLAAARRMIDAGRNPIALNFANGAVPGGGFLHGSRAQEEAICRCSALYETLVGDPMYKSHRRRELPDSTDWVIYSPGVPIFRYDDGQVLDQPWHLSFLTCAAPYEPDVGQPASGDLLERRIGRVLEVAASLGYSTLILGAWGCGAFNNDPHRTARDFRSALETAYAGAFSDVVFAIADWSPNRRFLGPFRDAFSND